MAATECEMLKSAWCGNCKKEVEGKHVSLPEANLTNSHKVVCPNDGCNRIVGFVARPKTAERKTAAVVVEVSAKRVTEILDNKAYTSLIDGDPWLRPLKIAVQGPGRSLSPEEAKRLCTAFGPDCECGAGPMHAKFSAKTGKYFLGCRNYPDCRKIVNIATSSAMAAGSQVF